MICGAIVGRDIVGDDQSSGPDLIDNQVKIGGVVILFGIDEDEVEWSGDRGTGVNYFSQDAVIRLAERAGLELPAGSPGSKLKFVQERLGAGDARADQIFDTLGVYLGYGLLHFLDFYAAKHVLLLGRVTSGAGGDRLLRKAREVLALEAPEVHRALSIHLPDEATRRVGQAIAAASLPRLNARSDA